MFFFTVVFSKTYSFPRCSKCSFSLLFLVRPIVLHCVLKCSFSPLFLVRPYSQPQHPTPSHSSLHPPTIKVHSASRTCHHHLLSTWKKRYIAGWLQSVEDSAYLPMSQRWYSVRPVWVQNAHSRVGKGGESARFVGWKKTF